MSDQQPTLPNTPSHPSTGNEPQGTKNGSQLHINVRRKCWTRDSSLWENILGGCDDWTEKNLKNMARISTCVFLLICLATIAGNLHCNYLLINQVSKLINFKVSKRFLWFGSMPINNQHYNQTKTLIFQFKFDSRPEDFNGKNWRKPIFHLLAEPLRTAAQFSSGLPVRKILGCLQSYRISYFLFNKVLSNDCHGVDQLRIRRGSPRSCRLSSSRYT